MKKTRLNFFLILAAIFLSFIVVTSAIAEVQENQEIAIESVTLNKTELALTVEGSSETLVATVLPANATNQLVEWSSSAPEVATVENGAVTPVAVGNAVITVKTVDGDKTATCSVVVSEEPQNDERWQEWKELVPPVKVWTVTFNAPILPDSVNSKSVYVQSNKNGKPINCSTELSEDNKTITINPPPEGYMPGQKYILFIKNKVKSASGKLLTKPIKMMFSVKPAETSEAVVINGITEDPAVIGKVVVTTDSDTNLAAIQAGITMSNKNLAWEQVDPRTFTVTVPGAAKGEKYAFTLNTGFTVGSGVDVEVEWAEENLPFTLISTAYQENHPIPVKYAGYEAGGQNISIPLTWSNLPADTKSLALIMYDLHPIANNWVHWAVINIPATATELPEGASGTAQMPNGCVELINTFGTCGYGGPEPPAESGEHQYKIVLYALNVDSLDLSGQVTLAQFESSVSENSLGSAELSGVFSQ
ncbi:YbhB/YbcL family Raf kinase inhibitor-like protein [Desulfoscipio gibsoniae]|uniref:Raf kinase inhibitor-like protein, YbhB/YbcL family n=1 Tax=Desulfoscipio gibsoniae DSM 7213 TaxID=767817 RepID=R4KQ74_9FIRM|nr:YbhB/YbcL family Raf kinase inhibitor-like protein [Desulfoscipio gibsoniae]AGL03687.1 Raf kinase inhibitor-like protein, YbhB/YbcL family [Desulfoscipio gibsoniae DSM 7213]